MAAWVEIVDLVIHPLDDNGQFVTQQYKDFANRKPNATESYVWLTDLNSGKQQPSALVEGLLGSKHQALSGLLRPTS